MSDLVGSLETAPGRAMHLQANARGAGFAVVERSQADISEAREQSGWARHFGLLDEPMSTLASPETASGGRFGQ